MNKKDILEIKRRFTKNGHNFSRLTGCYVNKNKEKILTFKENFLSLSQDELLKYLGIAKKSISGKLGNNLLNLEFYNEDDNTIQPLLLSLIKSNMDDDEALNTLYDKIIELYDTSDNYLILIFHDEYDIPLKTTDNIALGDSTDVYDYMVLSICPVELQKPALSYNEKEKCFSSLNRDWIVGNVESAFTYPAFSDRNTDIHEMLVFTRDAKNPHTEFWKDILGLKLKHTSDEKTIAFNDIITHDLKNEEVDDALLSVHKNLSDFITLESEGKENKDYVNVSKEDLNDILSDSGFSEDKIEKAEERLDDYFEDEPKNAKDLLDNKLLKNSDLKLEKKALQKKVLALTKEMKDIGLKKDDGSTPSIVIKTDDNLKDKITASFVDGEKCLIIPLKYVESAVINGKDVNL